MIGKTLKYLRNEKKIKQKDMAKILNIGQSTLSDYENEKVSADFKTIEKIAKICNYDIIFRNIENKNEFKTKDLKRKDI